MGIFYSWKNDVSITLQDSRRLMAHNQREKEVYQDGKIVYGL